MNEFDTEDVTRRLRPILAELVNAGATDVMIVALVEAQVRELRTEVGRAQT
jgi:hypothetical protein